MDIPIKIVLFMAFPVLSTIVLLVFPARKRCYIISALLLLMSLLTLIFSRYESLTLLGNGDIFFPLIFSVGDIYSNIARFAFSLTGALTMAYIAQKKDLILELAGIWAISSTILITMAENFLTLFLFWEMLTITTTAIIFLKRDEEAFISSWVYLLTHLTGGLFFLLGIVINYQSTGSLAISNPEAGLIFFVIAIGIKTAFIPFYFWLPKAYSSASWQGSVVLSALSTKVGVYAIARILEPSLAIAYMGGIMAVFGVLMALLQKKIRPLLSYHIISQVGYMVAGVGLGLTLSVDGALLHLLNHMLYKALLFMSAGAVIYATGGEHLKNLGGLWKKMPVTTMAALIGSLAIAGAAPFNGFISKTMLKYATNDQGFLSILLLIASVGTTISFCKYMYFAFFRSGETVDLDVKKVPWSLKLPMILTSVLIVLFGVFPQILSSLAPYQSSTFVYSFSSVRDSLLILGIGIIIFLIIKPFLNPEKLILPQRVLIKLNQQLNKKVVLICDFIKRGTEKEALMNSANSMWIFLFAMAFIVSGLIFTSLFL